MEPTKRIGVVVTCHNYARFLEQCIQSILEQTILPNRIIIIDDSSTDNTQEVAMQFGDAIEYYRVEFSHANKSRNFGCRKAVEDCEYIINFDADNYMRRGMIEKMQIALDHSDAGFVYSNRLMVDEFGGYTGEMIFQDFDYEELKKRNYIDTASMMRSEVFTYTGGFNEDEAFIVLEDWDFFLRACSKYTGIHIDGLLYYYRQHNQSKTANLQRNPGLFHTIKDKILYGNT